MYIVITAAVTVLLISIFPFLAPVAFVIMVVIFCLRLKYIVSNWRAVLAGFYMYGVGFYFAVGRSTTVDPISALLTGFVAAVGFHLILIWLYSHQYTLERACPLWASPRCSSSFSVCLHQAFGGFDAITDAADTSVDTTVDTAHSGDIHGGSDAVTPRPGPPIIPTITTVRDRTAPCTTLGAMKRQSRRIVSNNYSYHASPCPIPEGLPAAMLHRLPPRRLRRQPIRLLTAPSSPIPDRNGPNQSRKKMTDTKATRHNHSNMQKA